MQNLSPQSSNEAPSTRVLTPEHSSSPNPFPWWYPVGAQLDSSGIYFRVWAPERHSVSAVVDDREIELTKDTEGYFTGHLPDVRDAVRYAYKVDGRGPFPDPASRFQPDGPHKFSQAVDPSRFRWTDARWQGVSIKGQIIYEMHVGTFTQEGTYRAAMDHLPFLADTGITVLELMPLCEFPGNFGWGYDGVDLFAPSHLYGTPDDLRAFIDRAHSLGLAVILDVVYNHIGPDGNYLPEFSKGYFSKLHNTDWGDAIHFYGEGSQPVREFFAGNAGYWIREYHFDGLRLDATQNIYDESEDHIIALITRNCRKAAEHRGVIVVAENEPQEARIARPVDRGGYGLDAMWNDDLHHSVMVAVTGRQEAYYTDYLGSPQELISAAKYGFLYQGQWYAWQEQRRGKPALDLSPCAMITFSQNHDQIANSGRGLRLNQLTTPGRYRALAAYLLLIPGTPMLFQGQEFAASSPFFYFADHTPQLASSVRNGRAEFLAQFRSLSTGELSFEDPAGRDTFDRSKLDHSEQHKHAHIVRLHQDLLRLRREDPVFSRQNRHFDGAVLGPEAFVLRFFGDECSGDRLLVVNFGRQLHLERAPEPLLAPIANASWQILWSSENPIYGGDGTAPLDTDSRLNWMLPGHSAVLLQPGPPPSKIVCGAPKK